MKIILTSPLFPPEIANVSHYSKKLAKKLSREHDVSVVTYTNNTEKVAGVRILQTKKRQQLIWRLLGFSKNLYNNSRNTEIIYSESSVAVSLPAYIVSSLRKIPFVVRFSEDESWERSRQLKLTNQNLESFLAKPESNFRIKTIQSLQGFIIRKADSLIVPSDTLAKITIKHYKVNPEIITKNYNPIVKLETLPFDAPVQSQQISTTAENNLSEIISAISGLRKTFSDIKLIIVGKPKDKDKLQKLCQKLKISKHVKFLDSISSAESYYIRKTSDIFVLNTNQEKRTDMIISCFSTKTPIIATPSGKELISNNTNGIIIKSLSSRELVSAITRLLSDDGLKEKIQDNGHDYFLKKLTWNNHIKKLEEIFESLTKTKNDK